MKRKTLAFWMTWIPLKTNREPTPTTKVTFTTRTYLSFKLIINYLINFKINYIFIDIPAVSEESSLKITSSLPQSTSHSHSHPQPSFSSRYIPELIPLPSNSSHPPHSSPSPSSAASSDTEWQPSSKSLPIPSKPPVPNPSPRHRPPPPFSHSPHPPPHPSPISSQLLFQCSQCPATYKQQDSLSSHIKYKHNPSRVSCTCHLCGKSMVDKYRLQRHLRLHTGEKPFECEYCGQSFYRKDYHTKHLQRKHGISYQPPTSGQVSTSKKLVTSSKVASTTVTSSAGSLSPLQNLLAANSPFNNRHNQNQNHPPGGGANQNSSCWTNGPTVLDTIFSSNQASPPQYPPQLNISSVYTTGGEGGGGGGAINNLINMTSLTFDDLISADL